MVTVKKRLIGHLCCLGHSLNPIEECRPGFGNKFIIFRLCSATSREESVTVCDKNMLSKADMSEGGGSGHGGREEG